MIMVAVLTIEQRQYPEIRIKYINIATFRSWNMTCGKKEGQLHTSTGRNLKYINVWKNVIKNTDPSSTFIKLKTRQN